MPRFLRRGGRHLAFLLAVLGVGIVFLLFHDDQHVRQPSDRWDTVWLVLVAALLALELPSLFALGRRGPEGGRPRVRRYGLLLVPVAVMTGGLTLLIFACAAALRWSAQLSSIATTAIIAGGFVAFGASLLLSFRRIALYSALQRRELMRGRHDDHGSR